MAGMLCVILLAGIVGNGEKAWAQDRPSHRTNRQDKNVEERKIVGGSIGQDPFAFNTAEQMYRTGPTKPYDESAGNLINKIRSNFPVNYENDGQEGFAGLLLRLNPYRKTEQVSHAIRQWVRRYFAAMGKGPSKSQKKRIAGGSKKGNPAGQGAVEQGNALYLKGDFSAASRQYRKQLSTAPLNPDARSNLALAQLHLGNDLAAWFELELLRLIKPDYLPARINLSVVLERAGRSTEAKALALAAAAQQKNVAVAEYNAAWFHSLEGEYETATNILKRLSELDIKPKYTTFYNTNTKLLKRYGKVHKPNVIQPAPKAIAVQKPIQKPPTKSIRKTPTPKSKKSHPGPTPEQMYLKARKYHLNSGSKSYDKAMQWYLKAADKGHAASMSSIGAMYEYGEGVRRDVVQAAKWYRRAAEKGHPAAMHNLGVMYAHGKGVARDSAQAIQWYRQAADHGDAGAMNNLGVIYDTGQGVTKSPGGAVKWYRRAADKGHADAMANLGRLYENGRGVPKDRAQATLWYKKAAAKGSGRAMNSLGLIFEEKKDNATALGWYRKAAAKGHPGAIGNLGYCYETGRGVAKDLRKAIDYYRKAAKLGSSFSKNALLRLE